MANKKDSRHSEGKLIPFVLMRVGRSQGLSKKKQTAFGLLRLLVSLSSPPLAAAAE